MLDLDSEFGARAERRLRDEQVIWLVTVAPDGTPQPSPVWFLWDGQSFLLFSQPGKPKLRNIQHNPRVTLHLDGDGRGGNIIVIIGRAELLSGPVASEHTDALLDKYRATIAAMGTTPEALAADYSVPFRVTPTNVRGH
jgi:PPOX class probable F420-dependent enzyme